MIRDQIKAQHDATMTKRAEWLYSVYKTISHGVSERGAYLDVGCGMGVNTNVFGKRFDYVYCVDINHEELKSCRGDRIQSSAQCLPFDDERFNRVTAISLIEHIHNQASVLSESMRVLKPGGELIIQFPNRRFFIELHSGIPFYYMIPDRLKPWVAARCGCTGVNEIDIPRVDDVVKKIKSISGMSSIKTARVVYPIEVIPYRFKRVYSVLKRMGILNVVPFGWMIVCKK